MDDKNNKKRESIDDILSDLNGLLNKMPSILDGIKMPELKPVEFGDKKAPAPAPAPGPEAPAPAPEAQDADKTVVLPPFSGLAEGASAPAQEPPPAAEEKVPPGVLPDPFDGDKTVVLESFSGLQVGEPAPAAAREPKAEEIPALKSEEAGADASADIGIPDIEALMRLSDDAVAAAAAEPAPAPAAEAAPAEAAQAPVPAADAFPAEAEPQAAGIFAAPRADGLVVKAEPEQESPVQAADAFPAEAEPQPADVFSPPPTADLAPGQDAAAGQPAVEASAAIPSLEPAAAPDEPSMDDLAEFERQMAAAIPAQDGDRLDAAPQDAAVLESPAFTLEPALEATPAIPEAALPELLPEAVVNGLEAPAVEAQPEMPGVMQFESPVDAAAETLQAPAAEAPAKAVQPEPAASPEALQFEPASGAQEAAPDLFAQTGAEAPVLPGDAQDETLQFGAAPDLSSAEGGIGSVHGDQPPGLSSASDEPQLTVGGEDGDKTVVMNAPSGSPEDEKTVIFQASAAPGITTRAGSGDLAELSVLQLPAGIPEERVRSLFFLYSPQDAALCASLLAELDAVCLRSQTAPMFIKRAGVNVFDPDMNSNFVLQTVTDSGAHGLVCVGGIPQDKVYEIENVFSGSPLYFRHLDTDGFSHTAVLNLVLDMIVR